MIHVGEENRLLNALLVGVVWARLSGPTGASRYKLLCAVEGDGDVEKVRGVHATGEPIRVVWDNERVSTFERE